MTYREAAQSAIDCQNGCNSSGIIKSMANPVIDALWERAQLKGHGSRWINSHPIIALYLHKICELNSHTSMSSISSSYGECYALVERIASGLEDDAY